MIEKIVSFLKCVFARLNITRRKGGAEIISAIVACTVISVVSYKGADFAELAYSSLASYNHKNVAMQHAMNEVERIRNIKYSEVEALEGSTVSDVEGSNHAYTKKIVVEDSEEIPVKHSTGTAFVKGKKVTVEIGRGSSEKGTYNNVTDAKFVIHRVDPASFDSSINMVTNDANSNSSYQAMSANALKDLLDSKISDNANDVNEEVALSARAAKEFMSGKLVDYLKLSDGAKREKESGVGTSYQGVYINVDGKTVPCNVVMRGKNTNDPNALILVPVKAGNDYYFDTIKRSDLYRGYSDYTYLPFTIVQVPHQTITVVVDNVDYTNDFIIKRGSTWTAFVTPDVGYNAGTLSAKAGVAAGAITLTATAPSLKKFNFVIKQSDNQLIKVTANGKTYTSDFIAEYGTKWTATVTPDEGYNAGVLTAASGTVTGNVTLSASAAAKKKYTITINQIPNQTIVVTAGGKDYTSTFTAEHGTKWTAKVVPDTGYNAGTISLESGTLTGDISISVTPAVKKKYTFTINQTANQTITVTAGGKDYTSSFEVEHGTQWTAKVTPATGYNAGVLNLTSGTVTGPVTVSAGAASKKIFTVTINQSPNQTITVTAGGKDYTSTFTAEYGTEWTAKVTPATGYNSGTLNITSGTLTGNITVSASAAAKKIFTITINQTANQTITVTAGGKSYTSTFTAEYGTEWTAKVTPATGYNAGALNLTSGTLKGNITISAEAATKKVFTVTITQSPNQTITVTAGGKNYTSSFTAEYGTTWTAKVVAETGYNTGTLSASSGTVTGPVTISVSTASVKTYSLSVPAVSTGVASYSVKITKGSLGSMPSGWTSGTAKSSITSATSVSGIPYGSTYEVVYTAAEGYNLSKTKDSGTITSNISLAQPTGSVIYRNISIPAVTTGVSGYTIKLTKGSLGSLPDGYTSGTATASKTAATTISVPYGTQYLIVYTPVTGYGLSRNSDSGTVKDSNISLSMPTSSVKTFTLNVAAVTAGVKNYSVKITKGSLGSMPSGWTSGTAKTGITSATSVTGIPYGSTYEVVYTVDTGYTLGKSKDSGTFTGNVSLIMPTVSVIYRTLSVPAVSPEIASYTIKLTKGSLGSLPDGYTNGAVSAAKTAATSISVPYGTQYVVSYTASKGYNLSKSSDSGTVTTSNVSVTMPSATVKTFSLSVPAVSTGIANYSVKITKGSLGSMPSGWTSGTAKTGITSATSVTGIPYGSTYEVVYTATAGYNLSKIKDSGTITSNVSLVQPLGSVIYRNISVPAVTTGVSSYTIKLTKGSLGTLPDGYTNGTASAAKTAATSISVPYGTQYVVSYNASAGYNLSKSSDSGTVTTSNVSITMPSATVKTFSLSVPAVPTGVSSYSVKITKGSLGNMPSGWTSGTAKTGITSAISVTGIPYGSTYEVVYTATAGYSLNKSKDSGTFTGNVSLIMPTASVIYKTLSVPAVSTGIASYTIKLTKGSLGTLPSGYTNGTASAAKTAATSISVPYGTQYVVGYNASTGYNLSKSGDSGTMSDFNISCMLPTATVKTFSLSVPAVPTGVSSYSVKITKGSLGSMPSGWTSGTAKTGITSATSVTGIPYGSTYEVVYTATAGYSLNKFKNSGTFTGNVSLIMPTASVVYSTLSVPVVSTGISSYTIKLTKGSLGSLPDGYTNGIASAAKTDATSISVPYGTQYVVSYTASTGYDLSKFSDSGTALGSDVSVTMPSATVKTYKLTVPATTEGIDSYSVTITKGSLGTMPSGWTSGSKVNGITFSLSVPDVPYGSSYLVEYFPSQGYTISKSKDSGNFDRDIACALPTATLKTFNFTINQSANQTITVTTDDGVQHTSSFVANYGTTWTATIAADTGYRAGTLSATSGTVTGDYTLSATEATDPTGQDFLVTIIPGAHQEIGVLDYRSSSSYYHSFTVKYGDRIRLLGIYPDSGYTAGEISVSGEYSGNLGNLVVLGPVTISASDATVAKYTFKIVQSDHQTITVTTSDGVKHTSDFTVSHGTTWTAEIVAEEGYLKGVLSATSGTVTNNYTLSATEATEVSEGHCLVTIIPGAHQEIGVLYFADWGNVYTSSFIVEYGDQIRVLGVHAEDGYTAGEISVSGEYSGNPGQLTVLGPVTISASEATVDSIPSYTFKIVQSDNQTITVRTSDGVSHTSDFIIKEGTSWTASVVSYTTGYNAGTLSATSGTITGPVTLTATAATKQDCTVYVNQKPHATITVTRYHDGTSTNYTSHFTAKYGDIISVSVTPDNGYTAGEIYFNGPGFSDNIQGPHIKNVLSGWFKIGISESLTNVPDDYALFRIASQNEMDNCALNDKECPFVGRYVFLPPTMQQYTGYKFPWYYFHYLPSINGEKFGDIPVYLLDSTSSNNDCTLYSKDGRKLINCIFTGSYFGEFQVGTGMGLYMNLKDEIWMAVGSHSSIKANYGKFTLAGGAAINPSIVQELKKNGGWLRMKIITPLRKF